METGRGGRKTNIHIILVYYMTFSNCLVLWISWIEIRPNGEIRTNVPVLSRSLLKKLVNSERSQTAMQWECIRSTHSRNYLMKASCQGRPIFGMDGLRGHRLDSNRLVGNTPQMTANPGLQTQKTCWLQVLWCYAVDDIRVFVFGFGFRAIWRRESNFLVTV